MITKVEADQDALGLLDDELTEMDRRYGKAACTVEAASYHVDRAKKSLDQALTANPVDEARVLDRLIHLTAVCFRFADVRVKADGCGV